jgi:hypothetical protein
MHVGRHTPTRLLSSCAPNHNDRLIQEFEREARADGMPTRELADRKRKLVGQFNAYVNAKKTYASTEAGRSELLGAAAGSGQESGAGGGGQTTDGERASVCQILRCQRHAASNCAVLSRVCCAMLCHAMLCCATHRRDDAGAHEGWAQGRQGD